METTVQGVETLKVRNPQYSYCSYSEQYWGSPVGYRLDNRLREITSHIRSQLRVAYGSQNAQEKVNLCILINFWGAPEVFKTSRLNSADLPSKREFMDRLQGFKAKTWGDQVWKIAVQKAARNFEWGKA